MGRKSVSYFSEYTETLRSAISAPEARASLSKERVRQPPCPYRLAVGDCSTLYSKSGKMKIDKRPQLDLRLVNPRSALGMRLGPAVLKITHHADGNRISFIIYYI